MKDFLNNTGKKISEFWGKLRKPLRILIIAVAVLMIGGIVAVLAASGQQEYTALFTGMDSAEAGEVFQKLQDDGVEARVADGTVMVPKEQADTLRLQLNAQGYPKQGLNYDFYIDNAAAFGMTETEKRTIYQMQLQQNIAQTLRTMSKIKNCTVMVNLAEDSKYVLTADEKTEASASVTLELAEGEELTSKEVETVRAVVEKSVPGLKSENITIADTNLNNYMENENIDIGSDVTSQLSLTQQVRKSLEDQLVKLYTPVFGADKLSASVSVTLDFDKATTNTVTLSPITDYGEENNIGIVTEMKRTRERILNGEEAQGEPGVDENGGAPTYEELTDEELDSTYYKITEEYNARVNEINETLEKAQGTITGISCTLLIDGGDEITELLPDIRTQISTAIGVPEDKISVMNQTFATGEDPNADDPNAGEIVPGTESSGATAIIIVAAVLLLIVVLVAVLMARRNKKTRQEMEELQRRWAAERRNRELDIAADEELSVEDLLQPQDSDNLTTVRKLVDTNPEAVAQLLRNWLNSEYNRR